MANFSSILLSPSKIIFKAGAITPVTPLPSFTIVPKVLRVEVKPFITLTGIPTPGGTDVGNGNALIIFIATSIPVRILFNVAEVSDIVVNAV